MGLFTIIARLERGHIDATERLWQFRLGRVLPRAIDERVDGENECLLSDGRLVLVARDGVIAAQGQLRDL